MRTTAAGVCIACGAPPQAAHSDTCQLMHPDKTLGAFHGTVPLTPEEIVAQALERDNNTQEPRYVLHQCHYDHIARVAVAALLTSGRLS